MNSAYLIGLGTKYHFKFTISNFLDQIWTQRVISGWNKKKWTSLFNSVYSNKSGYQILF